MVGVAQHARALARGLVELEGARVLAAEVMEVGDVVVGLDDEPRQAVRVGEAARLLVQGESAREIVQADLAHGQVAQGHRDVVRLADGGEGGAGPLVEGEGLRELIPPVVEVADVGVQARQPEVERPAPVTKR